VSASPFADLPTVAGGFKCIAADPPFRFVTYSDKGQGRSPSRHYGTMTPVEIMALPVRQIAAFDCWLFLWLPDVHIIHLGPICGHWGFGVSGKAFTWVKRRQSRNDESDLIPIGGLEFAFPIGCVHTTRKNSESCWLGRRGRPGILAHDVRELIVAPRREHSRKPAEAYERIERFCSGPRLDLFGRQSRRGWTVFGDEATKFDVAAE
jgi:N6-adenosine-specific RNA methylase IME4